jgi:hypothetical protein
MIPLVLLVIFVLVSAGAAVWVLTLGQHSQAVNDTPAATNQARATLSPGLTGTQHPFAAPTSSPGTFPSMIGSYAGTIADVSNKSTTPVLFQIILQLGGNISGFFTVGPPFSMSGPFQGTVDHTRQFHFTVRDAADHPFLFLEGAPQPGAFQKGTYLSGDFYSCAKTQTAGDSCTTTKDTYGLWTVMLVVTGS